MKTLFRILIVILIILLIYNFTTNSSYELEPLKGPNSSTPVIPKTDYPEGFEDALPRPSTGISTLIDQDSKKVIEKYGKPQRIDQTEFGYEWWVYNEDFDSFVMFGIENGIVTQVYVAGEKLDAQPYKIGQSLDEIYRMTIVDTEVTAQDGDNLYTFALNEEDMRTRILTKFEGIFAQLYIDGTTEKLTGIRFVNSKTLVKHRPYEMTFVGELISAPSLNSYKLMKRNEASSKQLFDLVNLYRYHHQVPLLEWDQEASIAAMEHSEDMYTEKYLSHDSPNNGSLKERLELHQVSYKEVGENLASDYFDAIEACHGWFNSEDHRDLILNEKFTHVGSGAFLNYYTQVFLNKP